MYMENLAPIVLFVYNRISHTRKTVDALKKNDLAVNSHLIVISDGAKSEKESRKATRAQPETFSVRKTERIKKDCKIFHNGCR